MYVDRKIFVWFQTQSWPTSYVDRKIFVGGSEALHVEVGAGVEVHGEIVGLGSEGWDATIPTNQGQSLGLIDPVKDLNVVVFFAAAEKYVSNLYKQVSYKVMYLCTFYYCSINIIFYSQLRNVRPD